MASGTIHNLKDLLKWKRVAQITDTATHTLNVDGYSELLVMVYGNFSGAWKSVQFNLPIWGSGSGDGNPINRNAHYYSGGYFGANAHTSALIQYNSDSSSTTIKLESLESNGTTYTSNIEMAVWAR